MIDVTVEIAGVATLSIHPRAGAIACLDRPERVTAARMDPQKAMCSDQTVTFRVSATPAVRSALTRVGVRVCRIVRPVTRADTTIYVDNLTGWYDEHVWLGSEMLRVTYRTSIEPGIGSLDVDRAQNGTAAISSTMPLDQAMLDTGVPKGRALYAGGPATLSGIRATYRLHDETGDEVLFRGVVGTVYDSGDMIELTLKSDIERIGAYEHPLDLLLYPFADEQYPGPSGIDDRGQLTTQATLWGEANNSANAVKVTYAMRWGSTKELYESPYIASTGVPMSTGAHRRLSDRSRDLLGQTPQPYIASPVYPQTWQIRAVAIFGADGARVGYSDASDKSKDLSQDWYMFTEVENDGAPPGFAPLGAELVKVRGSLPADFLGPAGMPATGAWRRPWIMRHKKNGVPQNAEDAAPYLPTTIAPSRVAVMPWHSSRDQFALQRAAGLVPSDLFAAPSVALAVAPVINKLRRWGGDNAPIGALIEHLTMEPLRGAGYAWPVEQWHERAVKDTYFGDLRAMLAIVHAPGPDGAIRPVYLTRDLFAATAHKITEDNIRDRDHTVDLTPDLTIERVTLQDLPPAMVVPRALWEDPDEPMAISSPRVITIVSAHASDEGYEGASITIKRTPILHRPPTYALETGVLGTESVSGGAVAVARACWTKAVENYGKPLPRVTLVVDRKLFRGYPGDLVDITLGNMPSPLGTIGVKNLRGQVWERGEDIERGTAEVEILLVGWLDYDGT